MCRKTKTTPRCLGHYHLRIAVHKLRSSSTLCARQEQVQSAMENFALLGRRSRHNRRKSVSEVFVDAGTNPHTLLFEAH